MRSFLIVLFACLMIPAFAQDVTVELQLNDRAYSYDTYLFPEGVKIRDKDKKQMDFKPEGVTLLYIWSIENGGQQSFWSVFWDKHIRYHNHGLNTVPINVENGADFRTIYKRFGDFLAANPTPAPVYFDPWGYVVDFLKVPGFPCYILVDGDEVVFTTLAEDPEGRSMLEGEIQTRLKMK